MKILIIGTRYAPIPNMNSGAIEKLVEQFLLNKENEEIEYYVYSGIDKKQNIEDIRQFKNVEFRFIKRYTAFYKILHVIFGIFRKIFNSNISINEYSCSIISDLKKKRELKNFDLVIFENEIECIYYMCKKINAKKVLHLHNDYLNSETKNCKKILACLDEVWGVSNFICSKVCEIDNTCENKIKTLYNGIDLNKFKSELSDESKKNIKSFNNVKNDDINFLYVGRIMPEKGLAELLVAFEKLLLEYNNINLFIVGASKDGEENYLKKLKYKYEKYKNVKFKGKLNYSDITDIFSICDVQVVPSIWNEAFGLVAAEGMAKGLALIVTNAGGLPEVIGPDCGIVIERSGLIDNLYNEMKKMIDNSKLREKISSNAFSYVEKFKLKNYTSQMEKFILDICQFK